VRRDQGRTLARDDRDWEEWLQTHRIELNAMTTPALIAWLDGKMAAHVGKLIPPDPVLLAEFEDRIERETRAEITERILRDARLDEQVAAAVAAIERPTANALAEMIRLGFEDDPSSQWQDHVMARTKR
jgi:hypothetical protein